jgi:hypothetical protein
MKTKALVLFKNRIAHFDCDLELVDVFIINGNTIAGGNGGPIFQGVTPEKHPVLSAWQNTPKSRKIALGHLRNTVYGSYMKDLYEEATAYFKEVLYLFMRYNPTPGSILTSGSIRISIDAAAITQLHNAGVLVKNVADGVYRNLEGLRSTKELINQLNSKMGLGVSNNLIKNAMPFFEVRHLLVHADGKANAQFKRDYPSVSLDGKDYIVLDKTFADNAKSAVSALVEAFDAAIIRQGFLPLSTAQP